MNAIRGVRFAATLTALLAITILWPVPALSQERKANPALAALVPQAGAWKPAEALQSFFPESLYEYIDGAAESYLSYDFKELLVGQLKKEGTEATLTVEIYDMSGPGNAFGIFSAERYPENKPVPIGDLGYLEGESLNFLAGRYYVKLLSFGLGEGTVSALTDYGQRIAAAVPEKSGLPPLLRVFPPEGLVARSEKFVKKNFLGYEFLHDGFLATYKIDGQEVDCFVAASDSEKEAAAALGRLLDFFAKDKQVPEKIALGYRVKNRSSQLTYIGYVRNVLCGVLRVPDGLGPAGEKLLGALTDSLAKILAAKS
jgi:hypothetical protein